MFFSDDGRLLASTGTDGTVRLWDANHGREMLGREVLTFSDFAKEVQCVGFSHNGRRLAACSADGTIRVWDATPGTGEEGESLLTLPPW